MLHEDPLMHTLCPNLRDVLEYGVFFPTHCSYLANKIPVSFHRKMALQRGNEHPYCSMEENQSQTSTFTTCKPHSDRLPYNADTACYTQNLIMDNRNTLDIIEPRILIN